MKGFCRRVQRSRALIALAVLAPIALLHAHPARAEDPPPTTLSAARDLFRAATDDIDHGRYPDALEKLLRVAAVKETSAVRFNIATCQERIGQTGSALASFELAAELARREGAGAVATRAMEQADDLRTRAPRLVVVVPKDAPKDLTISVDGHEQPTAMYGTPLPIDPGSHVVEAHASRSRPFHSEVMIDEAEIERVVITLEADSPFDNDNDGGSRRTIGIATMGAGAALGVGAIVFVFLHNSAVSDLNDACAPTCPASRYDDLESTRSAAVRNETIAWALAGSATVAIGIGAVLFLTAPSGRHDAAVWLSPGGPGGNGVTLHASF